MHVFSINVNNSAYDLNIKLVVDVIVTAVVIIEVAVVEVVVAVVTVVVVAAGVVLVMTHMSVVVAAVIGDRVDGEVTTYPELGHIVTQKLTRLVRPATYDIQRLQNYN